MLTAEHYSVILGLYAVKMIYCFSFPLFHTYFIHECYIYLSSDDGCETVLIWSQVLELELTFLLGACWLCATWALVLLQCRSTRFMPFRWDVILLLSKYRAFSGDNLPFNMWYHDVIFLWVLKQTLYRGGGGWGMGNFYQHLTFYLKFPIVQQPKI